MAYINKDTLAYPVAREQIDAEFPESVFPWSAPGFGAPAPYALVFPAPMLPYDPLRQVVSEAAPVLTRKGHWEQRWIVEDLPADVAEQAAREAFKQRTKVLQAQVQQHMDDAARALGYDDVATAVTYAEEPAVPKFQAEGQAFRAWRSRVWAFCYWLMDEVAAGRALEPTPNALFAVLPTLELPE
jgi:hypothetical protein